MKLLFNILFFLFLVLPVYAGIYGRTEMGIPTGRTEYKTNGGEIENYRDTFFTNMVLGYKIKFFNLIEYRIFTGIFTWANREESKPEGWPFEEIYGFGMSLNYNGIYVKYNHFCAHPVAWKRNKYNDYVPDNKSWMSQMTAITIGFEFEVK